MIDTLLCPICSNKLRNRNIKNHYAYAIDNVSNYIERTCSGGMNHSLQMLTEQDTKKVHFLKTSLNHTYSRFIEIDFLNNKSRISCLKLGKPEYIEIKKIFTPDFPELSVLKEKVETLVTFL